MSVWEELDLPGYWDKLDNQDKIGEIVEREVHAPYDLILDVWDKTGESRIDRETFETLLTQAIQTFLDYPSYQAYLADRNERY